MAETATVPEFEIPLKRVGDTVMVYDENEAEKYRPGEVTAVNQDKHTYSIRLPDGSTVEKDCGMIDSEFTHQT